MKNWVAEGIASDVNDFITQCCLTVRFTQSKKCRSPLKIVIEGTIIEMCKPYAYKTRKKSDTHKTGIILSVRLWNFKYGGS